MRPMMAKNKSPNRITKISTKKPIAKRKAEETFDVIPKGYKPFLENLKAKIRSSQIKAAIRVNSILIELYWRIGKDITEMQEKEGWGTQVIERLATDIQSEFPGLHGFSRRNLFYMRKFAELYQDIAIVQQLAALIPWGHSMMLMDRLKNQEHRLWYTEKVIEHGLSRAMLKSWIAAEIHKRAGNAITNFKTTLPSPQSNLAQETLKDPFLFDFLTLHEDHAEKDLEDGLINHIQKFLLELGHGFSFLGRQYPIQVAGDQYYIDLLFYHVKLRAFVVLEIKAKAFKPEDAGQLNFYLSAVDDFLKHPNDNPTIGILLCKTRNKIKAEYAFRHINRPMGVVEYEVMLTKSLPDDMKASLPTVKEIEEELEKDSI